ncbi:hypothetical protein [Nocardioides aurantiacus]|uniref:hypothetical protein n=1 Tax=Nocardioides aurantiacus TaxID=86796 RepID=UPI00403F7B2C
MTAVGADTTKTSGKTRSQASAIAKAAGMNPRGLAGYFRAGLLKSDMKSDSRWITDKGKKRMVQLQKG